MDWISCASSELEIFGIAERTTGAKKHPK